MSKAVSNIDTEYLETLSARAISIKDLCQALAEEIDHPDQLDLLQDIYDKAEVIRASVPEQREFIRAQKVGS